MSPYGKIILNSDMHVMQLYCPALLGRFFKKTFPWHHKSWTLCGIEMRALHFVAAANSIRNIPPLQRMNIEYVQSRQHQPSTMGGWCGGRREEIWQQGSKQMQNNVTSWHLPAELGRFIGLCITAFVSVVIFDVTLLSALWSLIIAEFSSVASCSLDKYMYMLE